MSDPTRPPPSNAHWAVRVILWVFVLVILAFAYVAASNHRMDDATEFLIYAGLWALGALGWQFLLEPIVIRLSKDDLLHHLLDCRREVSLGGSQFGGRQVTGDTMLTRYRSVTVGNVSTTNFRIAGTAAAIATSVTMVLWTLLLGWWSLPFGPFRTLSALWTNLSGGERQTVRELYSDIDAGILPWEP